MLREIVANNIKNRRKLLKLTQAELAKKVNDHGGLTWSQTTVYMIEVNKRKLDIDELEAVASNTKNHI